MAAQMSYAEIARAVHLPVRTVQRVVALCKETGKVEQKEKRDKAKSTAQYGQRSQVQSRIW